MATMNISLSGSMKDWVEGQTKSGRYDNVSEYLRDLIQIARRFRLVPCVAIKFSRPAENDLLDIFRYGIEHYGLAGEERYKRWLERTLRPLSENPRRPGCGMRPGCRYTSPRPNSI